MEFELAFDVVNWLAVIVAALVAFLVGGLWYSPKVFGRAGIVSAESEFRGGPPRRLEAVFALVFVLLCFAAGLLAAILGPNATAGLGVRVGLLVAACFVLPAFAVTYVFERRPVRDILINGGYQAIALALMGAIVGAWH